MSNDNTPAPSRRLPAWAIAILKYLVTLLLGGASIVAAQYAAGRPDTPVPAEIELASEFYGEPGDLIELSAKTTGAKVRWRSIDKGLRLIDDLPDLAARKAALALSCTPGRYRVECWSAISGDPTAICQAMVVIGDPPAPVPPTPVPPTPVPPTPVPPTPPAPTPPQSELAKKLQACWSADPTPIVVKTSQKALIIGLYEAMVDHAKNEKVTTTGELLGDLKAQAAAMLLPGALIECRKIISAEVATSLGVEPELAIDAALRAKAVDVFGRVARAMGEVK